jgi:Fe-S oxidoreductase
VVHDHCHSRALGQGETAAALGGITGEACDPSGAGCCGMAGAFGHLHPELSRTIGERSLAPAAREADLVVAAGTSCREQVRRLTGRTALHPAQYLAALLEDDTR